MRIERLGDLGDGPAVLTAVGHAAARLSLAPPAALLGDWFDSRAVIAPSVPIVPVDPEQVFAVAPGADGAGNVVGGGWFGYLSYPDSGADGAGPRIPVAAGGWSDSVLRRDRDGCWWYESLTGAALPGWVTAALRSPGTEANHHIEWTAPDRDAHRRGVLDCLEAIAAGEVYQACVCTQFTGRLAGDSLAFFTDTAARGRPARAAYLAGDWGAVASLSPELFLQRRGTAVTSSPIKGTLPRWADPSALLSSVKDVAENIMIVDLVRNDLGRVAVTGSVTVPELLAVRPAPGVWHLVSTVAASADAELPMSDMLEATFPPASVTGTPKTRARELLRGWERARRGIYCGTIGLASPMAGCELNVAIRTVEFGPDGSAVLGVGGGITADSDPDREWDECLHKAAPIVGASAAEPV
ncbi:aminodeoxychorismate synthase component I [Mycolicibacterium sp. S2-37]|uniref:aminodeoxychorismate synthase component I n=1 Tax=Mycolicibacterium sp. S2-37 TaxID=2810297 RepID=UPI001A93F56C|nr:aminodeoxychorismate synthase component I [Mycolicibacterium sp. S2-37]MBO0679337.1 aminodeoxychorismate synthase component I [Mycolicibacterium sp. S2-37]